MFRKALNSIFIPTLNFSSSSSTQYSLKIGDVLKKSQIFTDLDVLNYSKLTHDSNPLHFNSQFARDSGFNDRIVHGMLVAALFPRIIASHFPGAIYVSQNLQFKSPVYIGEEIVAEIKALNIRVNKDKYVGKFSTKCYKHGDLVCIEGEAVTLLPTLNLNEEGDNPHDPDKQF